MTAPITPQDRPELRLETYPHHFILETRSTDATNWDGHIPNGQIAKYADEGRLGMHKIIMGDGEPRIFQLVEARFQFFHELRFPGPVTIGYGIIGIGNSSLRQVAGFFRDGRCHVLAHFALVKVLDGKSAPLTADERLRAAPFLIPSPV